MLKNNDKTFEESDSDSDVSTTSIKEIHNILKLLLDSESHTQNRSSKSSKVRGNFSDNDKFPRPIRNEKALGDSGAQCSQRPVIEILDSGSDSDGKDLKTKQVYESHFLGESKTKVRNCKLPVIEISDSESDSVDEKSVVSKATQTVISNKEPVKKQPIVLLDKCDKDQMVTNNGSQNKRKKRNRHQAFKPIRTTYDRKAKGVSYCEFFASDKEEEPIETEEKKLFCHLCNSYISTTNNFRTHLYADHRQSLQDYHKTLDASTKCFNSKRLQFKCDVCPRIYDTEISILRHKSTHYPLQRNYVCNLCNDSFWDKKLLDNHKNKHGKNLLRSFKCDICKFTAQTKHAIKDHIIGFHRTGKIDCFFECEKCGKITESKMAWKRHRLHCGNNLRCRYCHKQYNQKKDLIKHYLKKHGTKLY